MTNIFLPTLLKIKIKNFTLYPNAMNYEYDFIYGVNLIIGGNGMGKTTFVNLIKYALIGGYVTEFDFTRTYLGRKIEKRKSLPDSFFLNRMDSSISQSGTPVVELHFKIKNDEYVVERCLEEMKINSFLLNGKLIEGEIINEKKYDNLEEKEQSKYLPYSYENAIYKSSGMYFDDLIFFANNILFFGEDHRTVLWNEQESNDVQHKLLHKYFSSPELNQKRQDALGEARYFDSLSRHKSEDIRAIQNVLKKINEKKNKNNSQKSIEDQILEIKESIAKLDSRIDHIQKNRVEIDDKLRILNNEANELSIKESKIDKEKNSIETKLFEHKWIKLHSKYNDYLQNLRVNSLCPMCNNGVEESFVLEKIENSNNCFLCNQSISSVDDSRLKSNFSEIDVKIKKIYTEIQNNIRSIKKYESQLEELDGDFKKLESERRDYKSKLRTLEFNNIKKGDKSNENDLQSFYDEIAELENEKEELMERSKNEKKKAEEMSKDIQVSIAKNTANFSNLFAKFAESFLGVKCSLSFTDRGNSAKRFYPVIDGKIRYYEEELSESQRFFVDHSFRMSILSFFYNRPTFYIVETPGSSLDISYEKNAADVFSKFLENPNSLIITSNVNNSEFIQHLIKSSKVKMISLLDLGKKSNIQMSSISLKEIYDSIKSKIKR